MGPQPVGTLIPLCMTFASSAEYSDSLPHKISHRHYWALALIIMKVSLNCFPRTCRWGTRCLITRLRDTARLPMLPAEPRAVVRRGTTMRCVLMLTSILIIIAIPHQYVSGGRFYNILKRTDYRRQFAKYQRCHARNRTHIQVAIAICAQDPRASSRLGLGLVLRVTD